MSFNATLQRNALMTRGDATAIMIVETEVMKLVVVSIIHS
jgi:hypothetical protein